MAKNVGEESKKLNRFPKIPDKYVLVVLGIISVILIAVCAQNNDAVKPFKDGVSVILSPIEKGMNSVGTWFYDKSVALNDINNLIEENERLKEQIDTLTMQNTTLLLNQKEFDSMKELLELKDYYSKYDTTGARIIAMDTSGWFNTFTIDKGENDGLKVDMNVIADGGLVGIITQVGPDYSIVNSIINDKASVSAMFAETSDLCIVSGDLKLNEHNQLKLTDVNAKAKTSENDMITTSHISDKYLPGILIGYVSSLTEDSNGLTKSGTVNTVVDFSNLKEVLVILQLKKK